MTRPWIATVVIVTCALGVGRVAAQPDDPVARADALFEEGRKLAEAGRHAEACPKFEESLRLDAGLGTLLNLAACYEETGRLASALTAFRKAEDQARVAGERKREEIAGERARSLETRVARLTITLAPGPRPTGFTVTRDGQPVDATSLGKGVPLDPGTYAIAATAPGHDDFSTEVVIDQASTSRTLTVPALVATVPDEPVPVPPPVRRGSKRKVIGLVVGGVGLGAIGAGVGLGLSARSKYNKIACAAGDGPPVGCTPAEADAIDAARARGNLGTIVGGVGVAALGAGVVLWLTAPSGHPVEVAPTAGGDGAGVRFTTRF